MDGMNNLFIGLYCLFGTLVIPLSIILIWGFIVLYKAINSNVEEAQQKQMSNLLKMVGVSGLALLIIATVFAYQNISAFFGAFPRP